VSLASLQQQDSQNVLCSQEDSQLVAVLMVAVQKYRGWRYEDKG
jgi:hypothetical protein